MNMPGGAGFGTDYYSASALQAALTAGQITQAQIDNMVYRILRSMFAVGIFDRAYPTPAAALNTDVSTPADNQVALTASEQGTVLLKNDRGALPLGSRVNSIAVIGDDAGADAMYGGGGSAVSQPDQPRHPAGRHHRQGGAGRRHGQLRAGQRNYRSLSALPDTDFTPTAGTGPGLDRDLLRGLDGQRHPARLGGRHQPQRHRHPGHRHRRRRHHLVGRLHRDDDARRHRHRPSSGSAPATTPTLSIGGRQVVSYGPGTGSTFTGLASLTAGKAVSFELDATGLTVGGGGGFFGPPSVVEPDLGPAGKPALAGGGRRRAVRPASRWCSPATTPQKAATCRPWSCPATRTSSSRPSPGPTRTRSWC